MSERPEEELYQRATIAKANNVTREVFELAAIILGFIGFGTVLAPLIILFIH